MNTVQDWKPEQIERLQEIGDCLKQERQNRNLTIDAVSEKTRIRAGVVSAIESAWVDQLPEPIYLRGFVRRYAEFLGLDGEVLSQSVPVPAPRYGSPSVVKVQPPLRIHSPSIAFSRKDTANPILWGGGVLLLVLLGVVGVRLIKAQQEQAAIEVAPTVAPVVVATPTVVPKPPTMEFSIETIGSTWLEVTVDGEEVVYETVPKGYQQRWEIKDKIAIVAGQAENVTIARDGSTPQGFGRGYKEASFPVTPP